MTTEPPTPFRDDDLSADLDGQVDPAVHAAIEADPAARARRQQLAGARDLVAAGAVAPLDDGRVEKLLDEVLAAADAPGEPTAPGVLRPSGRRWRGPAPWQVAAAVLALVAVGLLLVYTGRDDGTDLATTGSAELDGAERAADEDAESAFDLPAHGAPSGAAEEAESADVAGSQTTGSTPPPLVDLGAFASPDDLRQALTDDLPASAAALSSDAERPGEAAVDRCDQQVQIVLDIATPTIARGFALVGGRPVLVYEYDRPSFADGAPTRLVVAVGVDACEQVLAFER